MAGAACAAALTGAGITTVVFDKSSGVGGRMSTRRARWIDARGVERLAEFDNGAQDFTVTRPRFMQVIARAERLGVAAAWQQRVHARFPHPEWRDRHVAVPGMPALCRHLLAPVEQRLGCEVRQLLRDRSGWRLAFEDGGVEGPFDGVVLAIPAPQAARLLSPHRSDWSATLAALLMLPCWSLMAVTDDAHWPWDAAEPHDGPLALVARTDRKPGRQALVGAAGWVAHATPEWSALHLEDDRDDVRNALCAALQRLLPTGAATRWHHTDVHRWRYASAAAPVDVESQCWWDEPLGLGVCGDAFGWSNVESAWSSGDELADNIAASLEENDAATVPTTSTRSGIRVERRGADVALRR